MRLAPGLTLLLMLGPVLAGLAGTALPALGIYPALGGTGVSLAPLARLFDWPGLGPAIRLSLVTGLASTALALALTALILAGWSGTRAFGWVERVLSPLLSVPHAAAAFGLAFLIAPSGWIARALSPWATGWTRPPDLLIVNDPWGLALIAGLVAKEVPFLLLMSLAAQPQTQPGQSLRVAQAMGYGRVTGWVKTVFPRLYSRIRLPVYAVLAYSMSVVDMAMILGPATPPPLSVQVVRWMGDPDLTQRFLASAGAMAQLALVAGALALWRGIEIALRRPGRAWIVAGGRGRGERVWRALGMIGAGVSASAVILGLAGLALWSVARTWRFPDALPQALSLQNWLRHGPALGGPTTDTLLIAAAATLIAVVLTLACLEAEQRHGLTPGARSLWLLYLPLLVPQVAFLPGLQTLALIAGADMGRGAVILGHVVFVLPYVFLSLAGPYRAWDTRYARVAAALGAAPGRVFRRVRLPMLLAPVLTAAAVGFAVSVGQYLPTLMIGGGRVQTLTTEAVALASGGDRRAIGVYALAQTGTVVLGFAVAIALPRLAWANRRAMRGAA